MKNANTRDFLEHIAAQDAYVHYKGRFFFVNGCYGHWDGKGKIQWAHLDMYELESDHGGAISDVCVITKPTVREVMEEFLRIPLIDGKTFWELEPELEWV
ncbi:MAG: hypothetical protein IJS32_04780 [Kiritimatiellae bacterium]|nr:hypothetical protein [Kiritimatiellia bacterium]